MHNPDEDQRIVRRLQSPPERTARPRKAAALVREHFEVITQVRVQGLKTWEEIGHDLRPNNPIAAGTVAQAFRRAKRARLTRQMPDQTMTTGGQLPSPLQKKPDTAPHPQASRRNPFQHSVDPIREELFHDPE